MKAVIVLLVIAVAVLGMVVYRQGQELKHQPTMVKAEPAHVSLELQGQCARQAEAEFKREGYAQSDLAWFENHYNSALGKCFVAVHNTSTANGIPSSSILIVDAYEGKVYGTYVWVNGKGQKYWEVSPSECNVVQASGEKKKCQSQDEFDKLAKAYME